MPTRRLFAVGLWLCVTAAATTIVWAGTSTVAADLTDRPAPVVPHCDLLDGRRRGHGGLQQLLLHRTGLRHSRQRLRGQRGLRRAVLRGGPLRRTRPGLSDLGVLPRAADPGLRRVLHTGPEGAVLTN